MSITFVSQIKNTETNSLLKKLYAKFYVHATKTNDKNTTKLNGTTFIRKRIQF